MRIDAWARRRRRERGATAVLVGVLMSTVLIAVAAITVDLGVQRVARRDMQALADLVALDMSRKLDGTQGAAALTASTTWTQALTRSVDRNSSTIGATPDVRAVVGTVSATTGTFTPVTGTTVPTAVQVTASTSVGFTFGLASRGGATRSAVGTARSTACFRLGSYAAGLNSTDSALLSSLLNGALGLNVSALSYQGLLTSDINLLSLATRLGLGGVDDLATANVTTRQLFVAAAQVMSNNGDTANAAVLNSIATQLSGTSTIPLAGLITVATGNGAGASAVINALDLVSGAAFLANGTNALSIPSLGLNLGLTGTGLTTSVKIVEKAQQACGVVGAVASTSQGEVTITGRLASVSTPGLTGLTVSAGDTKVSLNLASATGTMTQIACGTGTTASPQGVDVSVVSQLTSAGIEQTLTLGGSVLPTSGLLSGLLGGLLGSIVSIEVSGTLKLSTSTSQSGATRSVQIRVPNSPPDWDTGKSSGSGGLGLDTTSVTAVWTDGPRIQAKSEGLLGGLVNANLTVQQTANVVNALVTGLTNGVLGNLVPAVNTQLLTPLQRLLGLELAGATVFGVPTPSCQSPTLAG